MEKLTIRPVLEEEIPALAAMAKEIWEEHFTPIIGSAQVAYMLDKFQSAHAIREAIQKEGYQYYFFCLDDEAVGYLGIVPKEDGSLFLSKIYLKKAYRGRKIARAGIEFLAALCREKGLNKIWLTCNRENKNSVAAYQKMGFVIAYEQDADIGNGFVMNDYIMEKQILPESGKSV